MLNLALETAEGYKNKLTNKLYGLLCEREKKNGNWKSFLENLQREVLGLQEVFTSINYWELLAKISVLKVLNYEEFRATIFECMDLIKGLELKDEYLRKLQK